MLKNILPWFSEFSCTQGICIWTHLPGRVTLGVIFYVILPKNQASKGCRSSGAEGFLQRLLKESTKPFYWFAARREVEKESEFYETADMATEFGIQNRKGRDLFSNSE